MNADIETRRTTCNRDCPDACSILVDVDRRSGRALRLRGDTEHPVTQGFLCRRTNRFLDRQYAAERVTTPLVRRGGELREASWDEALDLVARELLRIKSESGPAAIFHYRSGGSLGLLKPLSDYFFEKLGPCTIQRGDICSGGGEAAQTADFGECDANDLFDLENSKTIVLWGKNPFTSSPHLIPILKRLRERGAKLVLVDPVHHRTAELCDLVLQPAPGMDVPVALGATRDLIERGGVRKDAARFAEGADSFLALAASRTVEEWASAADVPASAIRAFARLYADGPAAILVGWGMQRRVNGGAIVRALDALATVTGNMGRKGGGAAFYWRRRKAFDLSFIKGAAVAPRTICEPLMGPELLAAKDPEVRAVWIDCGNPVVMLPESATVERALRSRELLVVVDSFLTDTARCATVFLPTTTLLEDDDLLGSYGHHFLAASQPALEPPQGVKTDLEILQALAPRVGLGAVMAGSARDWKRRLLAPLEKESGVKLEDLERGPVLSPRSKPVLFEGDRYATPSGKARLSVAEPSLREKDAEYPFTMLSISTDKAQAAQTLASQQDGPLEATVHPGCGFRDGERAWLASRIARIQVRVRHDPAQRRDVVVVPKGGWLSKGRAANALVRARTTDMGEGAAYYDEPVRLERI